MVGKTLERLTVWFGWHSELLVRMKIITRLKAGHVYHSERESIEAVIRVRDFLRKIILLLMLLSND